MAQAANQELVDLFEDFYRRYYSQEVSKLAREYPRESKSLLIDWRDLYQMDPDLADDYINHPDQIQEAAEEALRLYDLPVDVSLGQAHVRVCNMSRTAKIGEIDSEKINKLVSITGTVDVAYPTESSVERAVFVCQRCGAATEIPQANDKDSDIQKPYQCESCERQGPFKLDKDRSEWVDEQKFKIRESPTGDKDGKDIESIVAFAEDDIAGTVDPGNQVTIVGVVRKKEPGEHTSASISDKYIEVSSIEPADPLEEIEISSEEEQQITGLADSKDIYEKLVSSLAPSVQGYREQKLALLLQLFGGVDKELPDGATIRGDIHVFLIGDPGSAKTRLLQATTKIAPKALRTNGTRTTSAGLTAAATRTSSGTSAWELEAGPAVLADEGHLAVDDLDHMPEDVQANLHEPMEEQTVSVSKGDANEVLSARTSITAAANPKYGRFDQYEPIGEQIELAPALMSRFDLIFTHTDEVDAESDSKVASHILDVNHVGELRSRNTTEASEESDELLETAEPEIEIPLLRKYIAHARRNCFPELTPDAKEAIEAFYVDLRSNGADEDAPVPVSARKVEAVVRLAEASARMRLSNTVDQEDADRVIGLVRSALQDIGVDPETGDFNADTIERGVSTEKREEVLNLKDLIKRIEDENSDGAPIDEVVRRAKANGISEETARADIEKLRNKGELYEPREDVFRSI
ncbi:minichromosome maintenance protein MCM [Halobacterium rubrum]|uniref:minichromosome maintenance protein MCM n=1 Tax=Halobacterium TaxID=2239 RepID=UPI001F1CE7C3|nr:MULTISPECIES: minichromosome maintenance protein MCM [Halobacterium]MDH5020384.1 minichromosome maintenance protein MCM [Halobacterium rubrum]